MSAISDAVLANIAQTWKCPFSTFVRESRFLINQRQCCGNVVCDERADIRQRQHVSECDSHQFPTASFTPDDGQRRRPLRGENIPDQKRECRRQGGTRSLYQSSALGHLDHSALAVEYKNPPVRIQRTSLNPLFLEFLVAQDCAHARCADPSEGR
jgi:hypothetical protein